MATCNSVCAVCNLQHQTTQSTHWCIICKEPLCSDCEKYHNVLKATRNHKTISISDYKLIPSFVTDINQHCIYHNEMYQLYCIKHEIPICNKCVKDHGKCGCILSLDEVVKDIKTAESFVDLEQRLDDLFTNINLIRKDRESYIENITDQKKKIIAQICHLKIEIIQYVNKLEEEFIKELDQIEFSCCDAIRSTVSSLHDKAKEINKMRSDIQNMKKYASDLRAFLSLKEIQAKTTEFEKHIHSSIEKKNHDKINIKSEFNTKIQDILIINRFGSINIKKSPSTDIDLHRWKDKQVETMIPKEIVLNYDVKLEFKRKLDTACTYTTGCCVTKKGEYLFTNNVDNNGKVTAINAEDEIVYTIPLTKPHNAFDVAASDGSTVAISTGYTSKKPGISIVELTKKKVTKFIDLPDFPFGITFDCKSLICCVEEEGLHVISSTDYSINTIPNTVLPEFSYVSKHDDKVFYTERIENKVTCCLYSGAQEWEFKDENVLVVPQGVTVDNNGNVFVVGQHSCNVVVISLDGKQCKQILAKEDGLDSPAAIFFDKVRNQMLVTNNKQFAYVYNVSYF